MLKRNRLSRRSIPASPCLLLMNCAVDKTSAEYYVDEMIVRYFPGSKQCMVNAFNIYFRNMSVVSRDSERRLSAVSLENGASAFIPETANDGLYSMLLSFKPALSPGMDNVRTANLQGNYKSLKNQILNILNGVMTSGNIPEDIKTAIVKPLLRQTGKLSNHLHLVFIGVVLAKTHIF